MKKTWVVGLSLIGLVTVMPAQGAQPVGPQLTPKLIKLLRQEMQQVLAAHQQILGAMVIGDHATVAQKAQQIHDSFILKQSLTEQDREDLMAAVPLQFVELDRAFHDLAKNLAEAAGRGDHHEEVIYFNQMTGKCLECHSRFATDRFPGLAKK